MAGKDGEPGVDEIVDEAISKKRNVKEILVEMKDTSELMVDLAYSALLTNSREISEEVEDLEMRMDNLQYEIETMLMLSARTAEEAADLSGILHVAHASEKMSDAARDIVDIVVRGVGDHPIYKDLLTQSEEKVVRVKVSKDSSLCGKTLGESRVMSETGCYIRAVKRNGTWIFNPRKATKIKAGDLLIASGLASCISDLGKVCGI